MEEGYNKEIEGVLTSGCREAEAELLRMQGLAGPGYGQEDVRA
jgi:hypothetical protein